MVEVWKEIEGYSGDYYVSNKGNIKSFKRNKFGKVIKPKVNKGYCEVNLYKDGGCKTYSVHRFVAKAFVANPENKTNINHLDEDKLNNSSENLAWCTSKENANWGSRTEKIRNKLSKKVYQIEKMTNKKIATFNSTIEVSQKLGFHQGNISECCNGKRKFANNFKWEYAE